MQVSALFYSKTHPCSGAQRKIVTDPTVRSCYFTKKNRKIPDYVFAFKVAVVEIYWKGTDGSSILAGKCSWLEALSSLVSLTRSAPIDPDIG